MEIKVPLFMHVVEFLVHVISCFSFCVWLDIYYMIAMSRVFENSVARSEYFRSLFSNGMFESTLRRGNAGIDLPVVPMHNISPQIFLILMDYLYTGCFETSTLNYATVVCMWLYAIRFY